LASIGDVRVAIVMVPALADIPASGRVVAGAVAADAGVVRRFPLAVRRTRASAAPDGKTEHDRHAPVEPAGQPLVAVQVRRREIVL
jgi:hypothetical protein